MPRGPLDVDPNTAFAALVAAAGQPQPPQGLVAAMPLKGGLSGAVVTLVWPESQDPLVLKAGPAEDILAEDKGRRERGYDLDQLQQLGLDGVGFLPGAGDLGVIAYRYFGAMHHDEVEHFTDLERLVQEDYPNGRFTEDQLSASFRTIVQRLADPRHDKPRPLPLSSYLPRLDWERLTPTLAALDQTEAQDSFLSSLEEWWAASVESERLVPFPDQRIRHGDPRLANILVNRINTQVEFIDFGLASQGHLFSDLARFEVDLALRQAGWDSASQKRQQDRRRILHELIKHSTPNDARRSPFTLWRTQLLHRVPELREDPVRRMYVFFVLVELLKRVMWVKPNSERNVGGRVGDLLFGIRLSYAALSHDETVVHYDDLAERISLLGIDRVYVPLAGREWAVNAERNKHKRAALARASRTSAEVLLIAETGNSYLHSRRPFFEDVANLLESGGSFRAVICNPDFIQGATQDTKRKYEESLEGFAYLNTQFPTRVELFVTHLAPSVTSLITDSAAFMEPYLGGDRSRRQMVLFDSFEFRLHAGSHLTPLLANKFHNLAASARKV